MLPPHRHSLLFVAVLLLFCLSAIFGQTSKSVYTSTNDVFPNPDRGLYQNTMTGTTAYPNSPLNFADLLQYRGKGISLVFRVFYLTSFVNSDLSVGELNFIQNDFNTLRRAGMRCVVRFAYTDNNVNPDAPLPVVMRHLDQLGPLLKANSDIISVMQAGFIGPWGEWGKSSNGLDTSLSAKQTLLDKILHLLPANRMVQVRDVRTKLNIFGSRPLDPEFAFAGADAARVGFHNDAFLSSLDDSGTYSLNPPNWSVPDTMFAKAYLAKETRFLPMGGETDRVSEFTNKSNALAECARMHWSFLNGVYLANVLNQWTADGTLDEMKRRLGYRFSLLDVETSSTATRGSTLHLKVRVVNSGWASPFNAHTVQFLLRNVAGGAMYAVTFPDDPRLWAAGDTATIEHTIGIPAPMPVGTYTLLLNLSDPSAALSKRPEYSIRLANANVWEPETGYNSLLRAINIVPGAGTDTYQGILELQPLLVTGIDQQGYGSPSNNYALGQNFPNPFNPTTQIKFEVSDAKFVSLRLYDMVGRLVRTLIEKEMAEGSYQVTLDAGGLASGVYLYTMRAGTFFAARRCLVLK